MLSTEQKKLREREMAFLAAILDQPYNVRKLEFASDLDRVIELWANLTMVQQIQGKDHWLLAMQNSGMTWADYIEKLINSRSARVIVIENKDLIFGFAFMILEPTNLNNPKQKPKLKASIKEIYLEPAYRDPIRNEEIAELIRQCLLDMNIEYFDFDVKDLN